MACSGGSNAVTLSVRLWRCAILSASLASPTVLGRGWLAGSLRAVSTPVWRLSYSARWGKLRPSSRPR